MQSIALASEQLVTGVRHPYRDSSGNQTQIEVASRILQRCESSYGKIAYLSADDHIVGSEG